jgi:hypothetical protein
MVIKVLTLDMLELSVDQHDQIRDYWKREWHVYQSAWQQRHCGPLVAPPCVGTGDLLTT